MTTESSTPSSPLPDTRRFHPRAFGLLFADEELGLPKGQSHFIEGTIYVDKSRNQTSADGIAHTLLDGGLPPIYTPYSSFEELVNLLSLPPAGAKRLVDRVTEVVNRR